MILNQDAVNVAARQLFLRLRTDMGIRNNWRQMTADDKEAFRDDVRMVLRVYQIHADDPVASREDQAP